MYGLTKRQSELLKFIREYRRQNGVSPSYREMAKALSLNSSSGIHRLIQGLESRGAIKSLSMHPRSVIPTDEPNEIE